MPVQSTKAIDRRTGEERREHAIAAVLKLAAIDSPERITTARIADEMGLSTGAMFRHFADKDALWEAVVTWVTTNLNERFEHAEKTAASPQVVLEGIFTEHIQFVRSHPGVPRLIFSELQRPDQSPAKRIVRTFLAGYAKRIHGAIQRGQAAGAFSPDLAPVAAAGLFIGSIQGLVMQSLVSGDPAHLDRAAPGVLRLFLRAILVKP